MKWLGSAQRQLFLICGFEFTLGAYVAAYYTFLFILLQNRGLTSTQIGGIFALNALTCTISQPIWGLVADKMQNVKKVFIICMTGATSLYMVLSFCTSVLWIGLLLILINVFFGSLTALSDSWIIQMVAKSSRVGYGHVRIWGCIGFAGASYVLGAMIVSRSIDIVFPAFALFGIMTCGLSLMIQNEKPPIHLSLKDLKLKSLLQNKHYVAFMLFVTLFFIPATASEIFFPQLLRSLGGDEEFLGLTSAICAISEVPFFFLSSYLIRKYKPLPLILIATCFYIIRQLLYASITMPWQLIIAQVIQGIAFGIFLSSAIYYIDFLAPDHLKATSQTLFGAMFYGLAAMFGSFAGGKLNETIGISPMLRVCFATCAGVALAYVGYLWASQRRNSKKIADVKI